MIPKVIHYVWVGGKPLNELAEKCIASWKKYCPDFEIKRWDETNFDINQNRFCKEAYENKKWAFVADYIRLKVLYDEGGIYMDADVEVVKPLDDFLKYPAFSGFENETMIPTGIIASEKHNNWIKGLLKDYDNRKFILDDGSCDLTTNVVLITENTKKQHPNLKLNNTFQQFDDVVFFTKDVFCPLSYKTRKLKTTDHTYTIHWFAGSWLPKISWGKRCLNSIRAFLLKILRLIIGKNNYEKLKLRTKTKKEKK